jgi:aromatic-L-amino-acid/L-tryptophan decarboxylase
MNDPKPGFAVTETLASEDPASLDLSPEQMEIFGESVLHRVVEHLASLPQQAVCGEVRDQDFCRSLRERPPEEAAPLEDLLDLLFRECIPRSYNAASPGYMAFVPGGGLFPAALADLISDSVNRYSGIWSVAPALVQLETNVLDWFREWMQFPPEARGLLTTGGSMAAFNAILCARERHLGADIRNGVMYASSQVHHSVLKSARLAGIFPDRVRSIPVDGLFRLRTDLLSEAIRQDRQEGLNPFLAVSSAGTTNTGAVDPLEEIAAICASQGLWHHVDGAYGAFFYACEELRPLLPGLSLADSLTLDPHKGLFLPYGTGALLVRDGAALRAAHATSAGYLPPMPPGEEFYDPSRHGPDLTRGFPGLRVWLCIKLFGVKRIKAAIAEKRQLALYAAERLRSLPGVVLDAPPQLSLFAFHLSRPGLSLELENQATRQLIEQVIARGKIMLSGCRVEDRFLARVCVLSFRTRREHLDLCLQHIQEESKVILSALPCTDSWEKVS